MAPTAVVDGLVAPGEGQEAAAARCYSVYREGLRGRLYTMHGYSVGETTGRVYTVWEDCILVQNRDGQNWLLYGKNPPALVAEATDGSIVVSERVHEVRSLLRWRAHSTELPPLRVPEYQSSRMDTRGITVLPPIGNELSEKYVCDLPESEKDLRAALGRSLDEEEEGEDGCCPVACSRMSTKEDLKERLGLCLQIATARRLAAEGKIVVSGWDNGQIRVHHRTTDDQQEIQAHEGAIHCLCLRDGLLVSAALLDRTVRVWKMVQGFIAGEISCIECEEEISGVSVDGEEIFVVDQSGTVTVWDWVAHRMLYHLQPTPAHPGWQATGRHNKVLGIRAHEDHLLVFRASGIYAWMFPKERRGLIDDLRMMRRLHSFIELDSWARPEAKEEDNAKAEECRTLLEQVLRVVLIEEYRKSLADLRALKDPISEAPQPHMVMLMDLHSGNPQAAPDRPGRSLDDDPV